MQSSRSLLRCFQQPLQRITTRGWINTNLPRPLHTVPSLPCPVRRIAASRPHSLIQSSRQYNSSSTTSGNPAGQGLTTANSDQTSPKREKEPAYELTFTCKPCSNRSRHRVSKQGYHKGTVLITCPGCKNRHIISDHLKIFSDTSMTIEDLMRQKGELVKKGSLSSDEDIEFWDDGSTTPRSKDGNASPST